MIAVAKNDMVNGKLPIGHCAGVRETRTKSKSREIPETMFIDLQGVEK